MKLLGYLSFQDCNNGHQYARGWWTLTDVNSDEIGKKIDSKPGYLNEFNIFERTIVSIADVLNIARCIDDRIVEVLESKNENVPGYVCMISEIE
jgi:hypothetical protein